MGHGKDEEGPVLEPTLVVGFAESDEIVALASGGGFSCVALKDGKVKCWGVAGYAESLGTNLGFQMSPDSSVNKVTEEALV